MIPDFPLSRPSVYVFFIFIVFVFFFSLQLLFQKNCRLHRLDALLQQQGHECGDHGIRRAGQAKMQTVKFARLVNWVNRQWPKWPNFGVAKTSVTIASKGNYSREPC